MAALVQQKQKWVLEAVWHTNSKIFIIWPFKDKVCKPSILECNSGDLKVISGTESMDYDFGLTLKSFY